MTLRNNGQRTLTIPEVTGRHKGGDGGDYIAYCVDQRVAETTLAGFGTICAPDVPDYPIHDAVPKQTDPRLLATVGDNG